MITLQKWTLRGARGWGVGVGRRRAWGPRVCFSPLTSGKHECCSGGRVCCQFPIDNRPGFAWPPERVCLSARAAPEEILPRARPSPNRDNKITGSRQMRGLSTIRRNRIRILRAQGSNFKKAREIIQLPETPEVHIIRGPDGRIIHFRRRWWPGRGPARYVCLKDFHRNCGSGSSRAEDHLTNRI